MSRYIDAEILSDALRHLTLGETDAARATMKITHYVSRMPTADVVEVVRCRDCKFYTFKPQQTSRVTSVRRCNRSAIVCTKPDDYCSFGERTEGGEWIEMDDGWDGIYYECSVCKESFILFDGTPQDNGYNFCPNCGADMRGGTT